MRIICSHLTSCLHDKNVCLTPRDSEWRLCKFFIFLPDKKRTSRQNWDVKLEPDSGKKHAIQIQNDSALKIKQHPSFCFEQVASFCWSYFFVCEMLTSWSGKNLTQWCSKSRFCTFLRWSEYIKLSALTVLTWQLEQDVHTTTLMKFAKKAKARCEKIVEGSFWIFLDILCGDSLSIHRWWSSLKFPRIVSISLGSQECCPEQEGGMSLQRAAGLSAPQKLVEKQSIPWEDLRCCWVALLLPLPKARQENVSTSRKFCFGGPEETISLNTVITSREWRLGDNLLCNATLVTTLYQRVVRI